MEWNYKVGFYLFGLKMFEFLYHLLAPGAPQNGWFLQIWKINQLIWEFVGLYLLFVLQFLSSWDMYQPS